jgi:hypothetical protein
LDDDLDEILQYSLRAGIDTGTVKTTPIEEKDDPKYEEFIQAMLAIEYVEEPQNYLRAIASDTPANGAGLWTASTTLSWRTRHGHWFHCQKGGKAMKNRWVYVIKRKVDGSIDRSKARLVIRGFLQRYGIDYNEIFSPVVCMEVLRLLLAIAAALDWEIEQIDVKIAFLNGYLREVIYMEQTVGYVMKGQEHFVCKLENSLHGLEQAPRVW